MGACYSVSLRIKPKDEKKAFNLLLQGMKRNEETDQANYRLDDFEKEGTKADTLDNLLKAVLAGWPYNHFRKSGPDADGFTTYENDFEACYGWEWVMIMAFQDMAPALVDGSSFYIEPDNDYDEFIIENGKCIQKH